MRKGFITSKRSVFELALTAACLTFAPPALAIDKHACVEASEAGQRLRAAGKLREARESLRVCAGDTCPDVVRSACAQWADEVDRQLPTIVLGARDAHGDVTDVRVVIDGQPIADKLDGRAIPVDPGPHVVELTRDGVTRKLDVLVREGDKSRSIVATFDEPQREQPVTHAVTGPVRVAAYVTMGFAAASATAFAVLAIKSNGDYGALASGGSSACAPGCDPSSSAIRTLGAEETATDVMLGVTIGLAAVATVLFLIPQPHERVAFGPGGLRVVF